MIQVRQGRVNFTTLAKLSDGAPVMSGTFSIHTNQLLHYLIHEQLIVLLVTTMVPE
jgi:hypothetical protein